jgi:hypothetical protein
MWIYKGSNIDEVDIPQGAIGFLYKITHKPTGKWYIGRKMITSSKTKVTKGVKKKTRVENDWRDYWSSNIEIQEQAAISPGDFIKEILIFVPTKGAMTLGEEYLLHVSGALFDPKCLNGNIRAKIFSSWFTKIPDFWPGLKSVKV